ncbi:hypothetical protein QR90_06735 [Deinococcus radiopugnans]|uniref:Uncharacterized protein n=1 Tax=Deinococcus radiopugnans TaxID=57497 RepID=A0A0A7KFM1_9DEIO|nr:hypothetical protein [Deinococcus radiopugnans]AIZ44865.1 hypothetical protein QR90_06735 [Deinococcus radiopugnans]
MDAEQLEELEVLVGPAAWAYHTALVAEGKGVVVDRAYRVLQSVRLVAADILMAAAAAQRTSAGAATRRIKVGKIELEKAAPTSSEASVWEARGASLQAVANAAMVGDFAPIMSAWGVES